MPDHLRPRAATPKDVIAKAAHAIDFAWMNSSTKPDMHKQRILAIDVFRGGTMLVMIFVNALASVQGIPAWAKHVPAGVDGMSFVDVVFPAFLFSVGLSVPYAIRQRRASGDSGWKLQAHIGYRVLALLVLGVFMVNGEESIHADSMPLSASAWSLSFYLCAILILTVYPKTWKAGAKFAQILGVLGLLALAMVYRGGPDGKESLSSQWWGILGLIGWSYLYSAIAFQLFGQRISSMLCVLIICITWVCLAHTPDITPSWLAPILINQTDNCAHASIALCGLISGMLLLPVGGDTSPVGSRFIRLAGFAVAASIIATALRPYFGISKIEATPSWCLYSAAICMLIFGCLYWLLDIKGMRAWAFLLLPAGTNTLLAYLIPDIVYYLEQFFHLPIPDFMTHAWTGVLWAACYACLVMALVAVLTRQHIRLKL